MIEDPPKSDFNPETSVSLIINPEYQSYFKKADENYYYWDKVKYNSPEGINPKDFWAAIKLSRMSNIVSFIQMIVLNYFYSPQKVTAKLMVSETVERRSREQNVKKLLKFKENGEN